MHEQGIKVHLANVNGEPVKADRPARRDYSGESAVDALFRRATNLLGDEAIAADAIVRAVQSAARRRQR